MNESELVAEWKADEAKELMMDELMSRCEGCGSSSHWETVNESNDDSEQIKCCECGHEEVM